MAYHPLQKLADLGYVLRFSEDYMWLQVSHPGRSITDEDLDTVRNLYPERRRHLVGQGANGTIIIG